MIIEQVDNEDDILSMEYDNYRDLMDQLHPLREAEMVDIFPLLKLFMQDTEQDGEGRTTMVASKLQEKMEKKESDRKM